jgi:hypothetical protein
MMKLNEYRSCLILENLFKKRNLSNVSVNYWNLKRISLFKI